MTEPRIKTSNKFKGRVEPKNNLPLPKKPGEKSGAQNPIGPVPAYHHVSKHRPDGKGGFK